jgi:hypothetical protein
MKRNDWLAMAGLVALTLLAVVGKVGGEAVVTFVVGLALKPESLER